MLARLGAVLILSSTLLVDLPADQMHTCPSSPQDATVPCVKSTLHPRTMSVCPHCIKTCSRLQSSSSEACIMARPPLFGRNYVSRLATPANFELTLVAPRSESVHSLCLDSLQHSGIAMKGFQSLGHLQNRERATSACR